GRSRPGERPSTVGKSKRPGQTETGLAPSLQFWRSRDRVRLAWRWGKRTMQHTAYPGAQSVARPSLHRRIDVDAANLDAFDDQPFVAGRYLETAGGALYRPGRQIAAP